MSDYMILGMSTELVSIKELMKGPVCQAQRRVVPVSPVFVFRNVSTWVSSEYILVHARYASFQCIAVTSFFMDIHFPYSSFFHFANHLDECT